MKKILKKIKQKLIGDYSPDIAFRYLPVKEIIKKKKLIKNKILEVGSGDLGITTYLKKSVTGLDVEFTGQKNKLIKKVVYDGSVFPFPDNEFDLVISVDSLEHVNKDKRQDIINEIIRVAKSAIILVIPCGKDSNRHDKELADFFYKNYKHNDKFIDEHIKNGLPEGVEIEKMLFNAARVNGKKIIIKESRSLLNLKIRKIIMECKISRNKILSILYYCFLLLLPVRNFLNFGRCYRWLFYCKII